MLNGTETRSPTLMYSTPGPVSITSPRISCPRIRPSGAVVRPRTMCWSEPQMFVETTFRIAACGSARPTLSGLTPGPSLSSKVGKSMSWTSTLPVPMYATPRLSAMWHLPFARNEALTAPLDVPLRPLRRLGLPGVERARDGVVDERRQHRPDERADDVGG